MGIKGTVGIAKNRTACHLKLINLILKVKMQLIVFNSVSLELILAL